MAESVSGPLLVAGSLDDPLTGSPRSTVERDVRELVRRRGLDPQAQPELVRHLIGEVIADYERRTLSGPMPPLGDPDRVAAAVYDDVAGFGPLQRMLDDPEVEEIWINGPERVFVARRGRSELTDTVLEGTQIADLVERMLATSGRRLDLSSPFVDSALPGGARLHVATDQITAGAWAINIRKFVPGLASLGQLVRAGSMSVGAARFLDAAVMVGLNVLVAGGTQAGKTTLLNCLAASIPARERVVSCEEVYEIRLQRPDWVAMQTRQASLEGTGEITLRRLVKEALRMRPDRLLVGEVRQAEALDLLIALNSGLPGMCTVHANSAREAVTKLCTLPLLAAENVTHAFVVPTVAASVDLVVHIRKDASGFRRVTEIVALPGRCEGAVIETEQIYLSRDGHLMPAGGLPPHLERFDQAGIDVHRLVAGPEFDPDPSAEAYSDPDAHRGPARDWPVGP